MVEVLINEIETLEKRFLTYFDRIVLCRYRSRPDLYRVQEDDMGGELEVLSDENGNGMPYFRVRFGFRRLTDNRTCVAAFRPDLEKISDKELQAWIADLISKPIFAQTDSAFKRWSERTLNGSWESEDGPLRKIERELETIRSITKFQFGRPLFRFAHNPALRYPVAENSEAFEFAALEMFRLVVDGLTLKVLKFLATHQSVTLDTDPKTLNTLKAILPEHLRVLIHAPLKKCSDARNTVHSVPSTPACASPAFSKFHEIASGIWNAVFELRKWLELILNVSGDSCCRRDESMKFFPKISGPLRPPFKNDEVQDAVGKTIGRIEAGEVAHHPSCHGSEALILHFTDGTSLAISVGSNAGNLESDFDGLTADMFSTDLIPIWAPNPRAT